MASLVPKTAGVAVLLACAWSALPARAAGHLDVDDAGTLDPGRCQVEAWNGRAGADPVTRVSHLGASCRTGPVELGVNIERLRSDAARSVVFGPQLKWTAFGTEDASVWSGAVAVALSVPQRRGGQGGGRVGGQLVLPLTWHPADPLWVHANLGWDWATGTGARTSRGGLGLEWALHPQWALLAEHHRASGLWTTRAGLRWHVADDLTIDLTASRTGAGAARGFFIGLTREFGAPWAARPR